MTSKEKKEYAILGVLFIAILLVLYFAFFRGSSSGPQPSSDVGGVGAQSSSNTAKFLPNGTGFNIKLLQDPRFTNLTAPLYPTVDPSEVGQPNPFGK
ncbi:hypothetical protein KGQ24_01770 [Patescibacteria group bacterium]|nr:hypothetical protein [Patescibacteria group bacterium]